MGISRRSFLTASVGTITAVSTARFSSWKNPFANREKKKVLIYLIEDFQSGVMSQQGHLLLAELGLVLPQFSFEFTKDPKASHLYVTSTSRLRNSSAEMLFFSRVPGGLERQDYQKWLRSPVAQQILTQKLAPAGQLPVVLGLGSARFHQAVSLHPESPFVMGTSELNGWRKGIKNLSFVQLTGFKQAQDLLQKGEILSMDSLSPVVAAKFKNEKTALLSDGLRSTAPLYLIFVNQAFWGHLDSRSQDLFHETVHRVSNNLDHVFQREQEKYRHQAVRLEDLSQAPSHLIKLRHLEEKLAQQFLSQVARKASLSSLLDAYQAFRS